MSEHTRKHRDFIQNITIALLFVSAVLLFAQTQIYGLGVHTGSFLSGSDLSVDIAAPNQTEADCAGAGGRHQRLWPVWKYGTHHRQRQL